MKQFFSFVVLFFTGAVACSSAGEAIHLDSAGVLRWNADQSEVALFGANYCLPSSSDFRAAGYLGSDRRKLIEKDLAHFARMGWDGLRLALWGDWENSDRKGNLLVNEHLDLMDYLIFQARKRGISMLLTPIHRHSALWPDGKDSDAIQGFSKFYPASELGTNPRAIAAQQNYLRQFLAHVNPYTGVALKDEPAILFIELINEPHHHGDDFAGSVAYINALVQAVRDTGCRKILFHNLSQDFRMAKAIAASKAQGFSFCWYPTGLVNGHTLSENYLRRVDHYTPLLQPDLPPLPRIVYEFDSADMTSGAPYPAMVRSFREVGAQFATMFAYDMLDTAPYNLGWQTHYLNLVYSPRKAVSAVIAAEAMRTLPRGLGYGDYPQNRRFGPFRVSYEEDSSEMVTTEKFLHANDTATSPPNAAALRQVIGVGSSPLVTYEGRGAYFLDKLAVGFWRLEVYPDAVLVQDPFAQQLNLKTVSSRLLWHEWPMTLRLPDLGEAFAVAPLNEGNQHTTTAASGSFPVKPGVYLLSREAQVDRSTLPQRVGQVGLEEFVCPPEPPLPTQVLPLVRADYVAGLPVEISADVVSSVSPRAVTVQLRQGGKTSLRSVPLTRQRGYHYRVALPAESLSAGVLEYSFVVEDLAGVRLRHPAAQDQWFSTRIVSPGQAAIVFHPGQDCPRLVYSGSGDKMQELVYKWHPASAYDPPSLRMVLASNAKRRLENGTASLSIKNRITDRRANLASAHSLTAKVRGSHPGQGIVLTLVEADGTSWSAEFPLLTQWQDLRVPLAEFRPDRGILLPLGFPGRWNYWSTPAQGRGTKGDQPRLAEVEHLQISFRPAQADTRGAKPSETWADLAWVILNFDQEGGRPQDGSSLTDQATLVPDAKAPPIAQAHKSPSRSGR